MVTSRWLFSITSYTVKCFLFLCTFQIFILNAITCRFLLAFLRFIGFQDFKEIIFNAWLNWRRLCQEIFKFAWIYVDLCEGPLSATRNTGLILECCIFVLKDLKVTKILLLPLYFTWIVLPRKHPWQIPGLRLCFTQQWFTKISINIITIRSYVVYFYCYICLIVFSYFTFILSDKKIMNFFLFRNKLRSTRKELYVDKYFVSSSKIPPIIHGYCYFFNVTIESKSYIHPI